MKSISSTNLIFVLIFIVLLLILIFSWFTLDKWYSISFFILLAVIFQVYFYYKKKVKSSIDTYAKYDSEKPKFKDVDSSAGFDIDAKAK